jgi:phage terminase small subunit
MKTTLVQIEIGVQMSNLTFKPPSSLKPDTARWWRNVAREYVLEEHHLRLLTLAGFAWDRATTARQSIEAVGSTTYIDRFGQPRTRPEIGIERDSTISFARLTRELDLDAGSPSNTAQPPALISNRR